MRYRKRSSTRSKDPITRLGADIAEREREKAKVMEAFANAFARECQYQRRFRAVVCASLARTEHLVSMILVGQTAHMQRHDLFYVDKLKKDIEEVDKQVSEHSDEIFLRMVKAIYEDTLSAEPPKKERMTRKPSFSDGCASVSRNTQDR